MKVCNSLKNHSHDVRGVARDMLIKMATALGSKYPPVLDQRDERTADQVLSGDHHYFNPFTSVLYSVCMFPSLNAGVCVTIAMSLNLVNFCTQTQWLDRALCIITFTLYQCK